MTASDPISALYEEVAGLALEREEHLAKARECSAVIERLEKILARCAPAAKPQPTPEKVTAPEVADSQTANRSGGSIRSYAKEFFCRTARFRHQDYYDFLLVKLPDANRHSLRAELSFAKGRGDIRAVGDGEFESNLYGQQPPNASQNGHSLALE